MHSSVAQLSAFNISSFDRLWRRFSLLELTLVFGIACTTRAVTPAPDGGYPGNNTAEGNNALFSITFGGNNTAIGYRALYSDTGGEGNTATGSFALSTTTTGNQNTANGFAALTGDTTGSQNTANGNQALSNNTTGSYNTANGFGALYNNRGSFNTANGAEALEENATGSNNTANGCNALQHNSTGKANTAIGFNALRDNTVGNYNTSIGFNALSNNTGLSNIAIGSQAGNNLTTGHDNIDIGNFGVAGESSTMRIGTVKQTTTFINGIRGTATVNANAIPVVIDSAGQLGTMSSSRRFKDEIRPMDESSEAILGLKPVTFHYKSDMQNTLQFGLIAEEVAEVNPNLVVRDDNGAIYTVRYDAINAMLLNEFLKEHGRVQELEKQVAALTAGLEKLTAEVETRHASDVALAQK